MTAWTLEQYEPIRLPMRRRVHVNGRVVTGEVMSGPHDDRLRRKAQEFVLRAELGQLDDTDDLVDAETALLVPGLSLDEVECIPLETKLWLIEELKQRPVNPSSPPFAELHAQAGK